MGIANVGHVEMEVQLERLITPHGDCKPTSTRASLTWSQISLPLMGIANMTAYGLRHLVLIHSLPLMGIANGHLAAVRHRDQLGLITPHGDCKPPSFDMGDPFPELITPHGDCKPAIRVVSGPDPPLITPHGDCKRRWSGQMQGGLIRPITPHGDCKRQSPRRSTPRLSSHYPSWGLQTNLLAGQPAIMLITPHGDCKRACRPLNAAVRYELITPHGDCKQFDLEPCRSPTGKRLSLPLMGIDPGLPPWGLQTMGLVDHLITPHGDCKPLLILSLRRLACRRPART